MKVIIYGSDICGDCLETKAYLKEHADTALEIENKIREKLFVQEEQTEEKVEEPTKKSKVTADNETAK